MALADALDRPLAARVLSPGHGRLARAWFARPRPGGDGPRVEIIHAANRISFAQIHPWLHHAPELRRRRGASLRLHPVEPLLAGAATPPRGADLLLVQTWFTVERDALARLMERLRTANPDARIAFVDSFAPNDLRLAGTLDPFIDHYLKKSLFKDPEAWFAPREGDTNLTQFYGRLFGIAQPAVDWQAPRTILPKLRLTPNFFTAPQFLQAFAEGPAPDLEAPRPIDLHARLAARGSPWYAAMRGASLDRARALPRALSRPLRVETETGIDWRTYMAEMRASKLCLSPFGYGELCWRDVEAFLTGAVLVKPDMGHLETRPDLYVPGETYLPLRWDFSDLEEVVAAALDDPERRRRIAGTAFARVRDWLREGRFLDEADRLFAPRTATAPEGRAAAEIPA